MTTISDKPWDGSAGRYTPEQWAHACLIHRDGDPNDKSTHSLPVREPGGALNRNGVHAAASRLNQVQDISADQRRQAAQKLISLYHELGEHPPDHLGVMRSRSDSPADIEQRNCAVAVEVRGGTGGMRVGGYASVFDSLSEPLPGGFREIVGRSMWNRSKADGWPHVSALFQHRDDMLLGTVHAGSLRLAVDDTGLDYEVDLLESRSDVYQLISRGDVSSSSMAMMVFDDSFDWLDGMPLRTLHSGKLLHVSPVTNPAYSQTSASLRSMARFMDAPYEDIRSAYADGNLAKFFTRSDNRGARRGALSSQQKQLEVLAMKLDPATGRPYGKPPTDKQRQLERLRPKTSRQKWVETEAMNPRWQ